MPNIQQEINLHNRKIMKTLPETAGKTCNCSGQMGPCPMNGNCLAHSIIYKAEVKDENENVETYTGLTSTTFKKRFYKHRRSFNVKDPENSTTLSTHIWTLKENGTGYKISNGVY